MKLQNRIQIRQQQGISLIGLILALIVVGTIAVLAMKVVPTWIEYASIKKAIFTARDAGTTANEIQTAFDKQAQVGYFSAISGKDLDISRDDEGIVVSFSYQKKIPLFGPASLLMDYAGTTAKDGVVSKKQE
jgi:type II secretory pathway pseudopilin PulG